MQNEVHGKPYVLVKWLDAASKDEWHDPKDSGSAQECVSGGFLLDEGKDHLTITHTLGVYKGEVVDTCCAISIPKGCVTGVYTVPDMALKLKKVKPQKQRKAKRCKRK